MFFFFFQAEDGIRDADVTGVQTCALPISRLKSNVISRIKFGRVSVYNDTRLAVCAELDTNESLRLSPKTGEIRMPIACAGSRFRPRLPNPRGPIRPCLLRTADQNRAQQD